MKALVIAEHAEVARELCAGARGVAEEVVFVSWIDAPEAIADKVVHITIPEGIAKDNAADTIVAVAKAEGAGAVFAETSRRCKLIAGKVAAAFETSVITDVIDFADNAKSMYFGGVAERVQKATGDVAVYTVMAGTFAGVEASGANATEEAAWVQPASPVQVVSTEAIQRTAEDPCKADVVIAAGRGFSAEEDLGMARDFCAKTGAALACTRPLTEGVNWLPTELYVGVSGLMLSPKVYVAAGISGQMQHMVGCNRSGLIVAINKDKNAPIFKQCDYGIIGDIKEVLPALTAAL